MKIIAIHDGNNGHKSQLMGVINSFVKEDVQIIQANNNFKLMLLPSFLMEKLLFLFNKELSHIQRPNLIISIGKKSTPYAIYLKKKFKGAKLVFLMPSNSLSQKYGDLIFYHSYKNVTYQDAKYVPIISAPHLVNKDNLEVSQSEWSSEFSKFKKPITSLILGGDAKKIHLNSKGIYELVAVIKKIKNLVGGSIFITTSRRTGLENEQYLKEQMSDMISNAECFFWGYNENKDSHANPYLAMLASSKYVIISGESISMISESCSLPPNVGVYIFFSKHFNSKRYIKFHENMYNNNYAKPIKDFSTNWERASLNSTKVVVEEIKKII